MKRMLLAFSCIFILLAGTVWAEKIETPTTLDGAKIVTAAELKDMVGKPGVHIFDMRKAINYGKGHVPGAVAMPYKWTSEGDPAERTGEFDTSKLPADKNAAVVFYSDGPTGWKSYKAAQWAVENGYKNVFYFRGGSAEWFDKGYPTE